MTTRKKFHQGDIVLLSKEGLEWVSTWQYPIKEKDLGIIESTNIDSEFHTVQFPRHRARVHNDYIIHFDTD